LSDLLSNPEDVNLETQRRHKSLQKYSKYKKTGDLLPKSEEINNELTEDKEFFLSENQDLKEKINKQKELIKNF